MRAHCIMRADSLWHFHFCSVILLADYDSPWDMPKPKPSLLTGSNCTGAAASSPACTAQRSAVSPAVLSRLATLLWVLWVVWLLR